MQMEARLKESLEHLRQDRSIAAGKSAGNSGNSHQETLLQQLLNAARTQASRLVKLENICLSNPGPITPPEAKGEDLQQDVVPAEMLVALVTELAKTRAVLELAFKSAQQRHMPAGENTSSCVTIYTSYHLLHHFSIRGATFHSWYLTQSGVLLSTVGI